MKQQYAIYFKKIALFLAFFPVATGLFGQTILLSEADTYAHSQADTMNWGEDTDIYTRGGVTNEQLIQLHGYVRFDLGAIGEVNTAVLRFHVSEGITTDPRIIRKVEDNTWDEMSMTWNSRPALGDSLGYIVPDVKGEWREVVVTSYVQDKLSEGKVSFGIDARESTMWQRLSSREKEGFEPQLVLNGELPDTPKDPVVFMETFGTGFYDGVASGFDGYSSDVNFSDDTVRIQGFNPKSDYEGASGDNFLWLGRVQTDSPYIDRPKIVLSNINTIGYEQLHLSLGHAVWGGNALSFLEISYRTEGSEWTFMDNNQVKEGEWAAAGSWGYVTLQEELPATENLYIRIINNNLSQSVRLDDIKLEGSSEDNSPPSAPTNLASAGITESAISLTWTPSPESDVVSYQILLDGVVVGETNRTSYTISLLSPSTTYSLSVKAIDESGNISEASTAISVQTSAPSSSSGSYSWNKVEATIDSMGNLSWAPQPFKFEPGQPVYYIDFEGGDDMNDGKSTSSAFKHHPWDPKASGNAAGVAGIHTYVFKRGVKYRGNLVGNESGTLEEKIKLSSDPSWGTGKAEIIGSVQITEGWQQADATTAPRIPEPDKVYYIDLGSNFFATKRVSVINNGKASRVLLARAPNWTINDSIDVMEEWWEWTAVEGHESRSGAMIDTENLTQEDPDYWVGGTVWSEWNGVMGTVWGQEILSFDPEKDGITPEFIYGGAGRRYYIENLPQLLDEPNEYYLETQGEYAGRLFIRLENDQNPNESTIEVAQEDRLIEISNQSYIEISGLSFSHTTFDEYHFNNSNAEDIAAAVNVLGNCHDITVANCQFTHLNAGIAMQNDGTPNSMYNILISDNYLEDIDDQAITLGDKDGEYIQEAKILRNKVIWNGSRQLCRWYSSIPTIATYLKTGEIAGNYIEFAWGAGIYSFWGKGTNDAQREIPFIRGFIHHNKAVNTLLATQDWGGIEHWQGGPVYVFNNYSENARGFSKAGGNADWNPWAFPYYFDGSFKVYAFNNIAVSPYDGQTLALRNRSGYQFVLGMFNILANNTAYNFHKGLTIQANDGGVPSFNYFLGNIFDKVNSEQILNRSVTRSRLRYDAYSNNIFSGASDHEIGSQNFSNVASLREYFIENDAYSTEIGLQAATSVLENPVAGNFKPSETSEAIDQGVQFYAPFALSAVVGEWHFIEHMGDSSLVMGENLYMTTDYTHRGDYDKIPKNHLWLHHHERTDFVKGNLEDWANGAFSFDGVDNFGEILHNDASRNKCNDLNLGEGDFVIEFVIKANSNSVGPVLSKRGIGESGYEVSIDQAGRVKLALFNAGSEGYSASSAAAINDDRWYHVLIEVLSGNLTNIYIDGEVSNGFASGVFPADLDNSGDFYVGKNIEDQYFQGALDFLRISKGSLRDALTTIRELHKWHKEGPYHYDFSGKEAVEERDAGALEAGAAADCNLGITAGKLIFDAAGGTDQIEISSEEGFTVIAPNVPDWLSIEEENDLLRVSAVPYDKDFIRSYDFFVLGCNQSRRIRIEQLPPCELSISDSIYVFDANGDSISISVDAEYGFVVDSTQLPEAFDLQVSGDEIKVKADSLSNGIIEGSIVVIGCADSLVIHLKQEALVSALLKKMHSISLHPVPAKEELLINIGDIPRLQVTIYSLSQKKVYEGYLTAGSQSLDINKLATGMYLITFTHAEARETKRFIKE